MSEYIDRPLRLTRRGEFVLRVARFAGMVTLVALIALYCALVLLVLARWFGLI